MGTENSATRDGTGTASTSGREGVVGTSECQDSQLHTLFDELDADHSGKIEPAELRVRLIFSEGLPNHTRCAVKEWWWPKTNKISYLGLISTKNLAIFDTSTSSFLTAQCIYHTCQFDWDCSLYLL